MNVTFLPSTVGATAPQQYLTSWLVNESLAVDAGSLGFWRTPTEQAAVRHVFLSHTHIDHVASLPIFLENVSAFHETPVKVYGSPAVLESLRLDLFNGRVWADFLKLTHERGRFLDLVTITSGQTIEIDGMRVTAIEVNHTVPTLGFIVEDSDSAVVIVSDTGPTEAIWARANQTPNVKAVFLEATFPNELASLADLTKHLTPTGLAREMKKLSHPALFFAVHLRARCRAEVADQLRALELANLDIAEPGKTYMF